MKVIMTFLLSLNILASAPKANELKFSPNLTPYLKNLVIELYTNSKITQEYIVDIGNNLTSPIDNDFLELTILNSVLNTKTTQKYNHIDISQSLYNSLENKIKNMDKSLVFSVMISKKILRDIGELLTNDSLKEYNAYLTNKDREVSNKLKVFMSRLSYLQFWIDTINKEPVIRKKVLLETNLEILNIVNRNLKVSVRTGSNNKKQSYISITDIDLIKARREVDKLFFDTTPEKDPEYKAPENLPKPVDNW